MLHAAITQVPSFKPSEALLPQILDLERVFTTYEQSASETLQGSVKTALLLRCLPPATKNQIYASLPEDATYTQVREASLRIERQHFKWQSVSYFGTIPEATAPKHHQDEAVPMEVDAVQWRKEGGKGKKGKDGKGKKGQDKGGKGNGGGQWNEHGRQAKGKDKGKGRGGKQDGKGNQQKGKQWKETCECHICHRTGHLARDCWHNKGKTQIAQVQEGAGAHAAEPAPSSAASTVPSSAGGGAIRRVQGNVHVFDLRDFGGPLDSGVRAVQLAKQSEEGSRSEKAVRSAGCCPERPAHRSAVHLAEQSKEGARSEKAVRSAGPSGHAVGAGATGLRMHVSPPVEVFDMAATDSDSEWTWCPELLSQQVIGADGPDDEGPACHEPAAQCRVRAVRHEVRPEVWHEVTVDSGAASRCRLQTMGSQPGGPL